MGNTANDKYFHVQYDSSLNAVVMEWKGYFTSEEFREGTDQMLATLEKSGASRVLASIREMVLISMDDQKWMESNFLPRAVKAGFRLCAIVQPVHYFNKIAVENISYKIDRSKLLVGMFDNEPQACEWLMNTIPPSDHDDETSPPFSVVYDAKLDAVKMTWNGYFTTDQFRACSEQMLALLASQNCSRVLGDLRNMTIIHASEQQWLLNEFVPRAAAAGLRQCVLVEPKNHFNKVALETVNAGIGKGGPEVRMASSLAEAEQWLSASKG